MKVALVGCESRQKKFGSDIDIKGAELVFFPNPVSPSELAEKAADAEYLLVDAITKVTAEHMDAMPELRLIHSEGVAFNAIDTAAAAERGIYVCNNKGANAVAVAEHTVMLIMAITKDVLASSKAVRYGRQIETKTAMITAGIRELSEYRIGLIGFGDIGKEIARMLAPFGPEVYYNDVFRQSPEAEKSYGVTFLERDELLAKCDVVSLHVPVLPATIGMANKEFFAKMKNGSFLINTARGELMVNEDVVEALRSGKLAGAAFDTVAPEPVLPDNPLLCAPDIEDKLIITPHIAGVTLNMFRKAYRTMWGNIFRVEAGEEPINWVNRKK